MYIYMMVERPILKYRPDKTSSMRNKLIMIYN